MSPEDTPEMLPLVERAKAGDRPAFDALVTHHKIRIEALIRTRLGARLRTEVELDDVFQETILKALQSIQQFSWSGPDCFMRWIGTIAENVICSEARKKERRSSRLRLRRQTPTNDVSQLRALRRSERFERLQKAFDSLDPDSRKVVYLARIVGLPVKEVAQHLGRTPNATSILLYRALIKLRDLFGDTESFGLPFRELEERNNDDVRRR